MSEHWASLCFSKETCISDERTNNVGINVWCWSSVFNVTLTSSICCWGWNTEWSCTVCNSEWEYVTAWSFMMTSKSLLVIITINTYMKSVFSTKSCHHIFNVFHTTGSWSHCLCWIVCVTTWTIPVWEKFGGKWNIDIIVFCYTAKQVARNPKLISNWNTEARTNLVFPLAWHDLSISSRDVDTSIETGLIVCICNSTSKSDVCADWAIVRTLSTWVTIVWPT